MSSSLFISAKALARSGAAVLEAELLAEKASALGRTGHEAELALERLRAHDAEEAVGDRRELVRSAARAVWAYFVQREACGLVDHRLLVRDLRIPREVLNRLGGQ